MKRLYLITMSLFLAGAILSGEDAVQYDSEIRDKSQSLQQLKQTLDEKRREKDGYVREEKSIRSELTRLRNELNRLQRKGERLRRQVVRARRNLATAEKELHAAEWERDQWRRILTKDTDRWYRMYHGNTRLYGNPVGEKVRMQAMQVRHRNFSDAERRGERSQAALKKWQAAQARLERLKAAHEKTLDGRRAIRKKKQGLLKTTVGRRLVAEEEIRNLSESARELEKLIARLKLEKKRKTEEELRRQREITARKKMIPWPVSPGTVVTRFGKNRHPELDTYVISNGIRIKSASGSPVRSIGAGTVIFSGEFRSYGQMIIVDHGGGFISLYGMLGEISAEEERTVQEGEVIGRAVSEDPSIVYFEVRMDGVPEDPLAWLSEQ